ncbi:hypothetical protein BDV19DRAFT_395884 [Aspergillus venezuelensis]
MRQLVKLILPIYLGVSVCMTEISYTSLVGPSDIRKHYFSHLSMAVLDRVRDVLLKRWADLKVF